MNAKSLSPFPRADLTSDGKGRRESGIELYRIITMLLIVAHHYVVNSGLLDPLGPIYADFKAIPSVFLLIFGAWGKTGINCFVLITGYFMCKSKISVKKLLKLCLEIYFYRILFYLVFLVVGKASLSLSDLVGVILPFTSIGRNFVGCYLVFYLCIPFLNILISNMSEKQYIALLGLLCGVYVVLGSIPKFSIQFNYVTWFCVIYLIGAYLRVFPKRIFENKRLWGLLSLGIILFSIFCIVFGIWFFPLIGVTPKPYLLLSESNKILSVAVAVITFLFFKNLNIGYSRIINTVAQSTFGVLLIHSGSEMMRSWLWVDAARCVDMYSSKWLYLHAVVTVVIIFALATLIDMVRIKLIEKPLFSIIDKKI